MKSGALCALCALRGEKTMGEYKKWWDLYKVRHGLFWGRSVWRWAVVQYEQYPSDPEPVVVQCKYFEGKDGAEEYLKLKKSQEGEINNDE